MKVNRRVLFLTFVLLIHLVMCSSANGADPFPNITLPVHPKAINPEHRIDSPVSGAKSVVYKIEMPFPAEELTSFYDREFKKMGFGRYTEDGGGSFQWENFNPRSGQWEKSSNVAARYTAVWTDPKHSVRVWLYIAYKYDGKDKGWKDNPMVSVSIAKVTR